VRPLREDPAARQGNANEVWGRHWGTLATWGRAAPRPRAPFEVLESDADVVADLRPPAVVGALLRPKPGAHTPGDTLSDH